jgi:hypothetical protein
MTSSLTQVTLTRRFLRAPGQGSFLQNSVPKLKTQAWKNRHLCSAVSQHILSSNKVKFEIIPFLPGKGWTQILCRLVLLGSPVVPVQLLPSHICLQARPPDVPVHLLPSLIFLLQARPSDVPVHRKLTSQVRLFLVSSSFMGSCFIIK